MIAGSEAADRTGRPAPGRPAARALPTAVEPSRGWRIVTVAMAVVAALATWNSAHKSMWLDESYSMYTATLPIAGAIRHALGFELQPPLYFVLLDAWLHVSHGVMFGRLISTVAVVLLVLTIAGVARRVGVRRWPLVAAVTAVLPGVVWAGAELRGYAVVMCLATLSWYFFLGLVRRDQTPRLRDMIGYMVASVALLYCFYYGAFVLAGQWIAAVVTRRRWPVMTVLCAVIAAALMPMIPSILWQMGQHPLLGPRIDVFTKPVYAIGQTIVGIVQSAAGNAPIAAHPPFLVALSALLLATLAARLLAARRPWSSDDVLVAIAAGFPLACIGALRLFDLAPVQGRHFLVTLSGVVVLAALWSEAIRPAVVRAGLFAALVAIVAANLASFERNEVQLQDWAGAARYVSAQATADDKVVVYIPDEMLAFGYYYTGRARVYGLPTDLNLTTYHAPSDYAIRDTAQIADRFAAIGAGGSSRPAVWLLVTHEARGRADPLVSIAEQYLHAHYDTVDRVAEYAGIYVLHAHAR